MPQQQIPRSDGLSSKQKPLQERFKQAVDAQKPEFSLEQDQLEIEVDILFSWDPEEYEFQEKGENWYLGGGILAAVFIAGAILFQNYLMAVTFFLLALVVYIYAERKPARIHVEIRDFGIRVKDTFYKYKDLKRFWIMYRPGGIKTLNIETASFFVPILTLQIEDQNPNTIRNAIKDKLYEDLQQEESGLDQIARNLKL